jgi:hypothetical protein
MPFRPRVVAEGLILARSGDVWRAAVPAEGRTVESDASGERGPAAAFAGRRANPADDAATASRMHHAQRLAASIALSAALGGARSGEGNHHAHPTRLFRLKRFVLHCVCQMRLRREALRGSV